MLVLDMDNSGGTSRNTRLGGGSGAETHQIVPVMSNHIVLVCFVMNQELVAHQKK
jgi:hypothetical protein